jgi:transcriptional regulator with XRE-family HTH domain
MGIYHRLGDLFRKTRLERGLSLRQLSLSVGYRNTNKGIRRLAAIEKGDLSPNRDLYGKIATALELDLELLKATVARDRAEFLENWNRRADEPTKPHLILRLQSCIYVRREIPEEAFDLEQVESWASSVAREHHWRACLVWNRRLSVWFDADGGIEARTEATPDGPPNVPCPLEIGGKRFILREVPFEMPK